MQVDARVHLVVRVPHMKRWSASDGHERKPSSCLCCMPARCNTPKNIYAVITHVGTHHPLIESQYVCSRKDEYA